MATDINLLMGEMIQNLEGREQDVEQLLIHFLRALLEEQQQLKREEDL